MDRTITFAVGPEVKPADAHVRATAFVRRTLPMLLEGTPTADVVGRDVLAVVTELVDITARDRHSTDVFGSVVFDGTHVTVSVGNMHSTLPTPEEEPGLYLVRGLAEDLGQYRGDGGGFATWASVPVVRPDGR
ncbi:hypothetical protein OG413_20685 [Streptomyces sp. NBC_01433]|uniref:hypothetical protein n=1 Tax=Streptomyces sp. NBC_01433 TaxID=2903864 RepID=UPI00224CF220|nr:hypothetical protein [Streptomyces sp. NBC_01433]MCX4677692.1 hypothetical protein [Streptomyces sp. NBC_01433]